MEEKQEPIEKFYNQLTKLEHKINKHIKTIEHILQYPSEDDEQEEQTNLAELEHNSRLIGKQIVKFKKQIDNALYQFQITSANTGQLNVRYNILRQSRKELYQHNNQLKYKLENGREKLKRLKKLSHTLSALQNQHSIQKTSVNKLQQAYNRAIKLQKQMEQKAEQLSNKQQNIIYELQLQRNKDIQISQFWKTRQKYDKLVNHKNLIHKHIQSRVHQSNKIYSNKSKELEYANNKINNYAEVFHQLEVTTNEQNFIIKEIMLREGLTALQLLQQVNVQYGEQFLFQDNFNKINDQDYLSNQIKKFRRKIGTQANSSQKISQIGRRKSRVKTDYLHHMKQFSRIKYKYDEFKSQRPETMQKHLRMTTKIPLSQPKQPMNLNSIKSMQIYPTKLRNLEIKEKIYDQKINSPNLNNTNKQKLNQQIQSQTQNLHKRLVQQNLTQSVYAIPITHEQLSSFSTPKHQNSKKISRNSQSKGIKFDDYTQKKSEIASRKQSNSDLAKQQKIQDLQFNFRIRTKQGYVYKTRKFNSYQSEHLDDLSSQNSSYFREKSEIIQLYDKLSKQEKSPKKNIKRTPDINDSAFSDINNSTDSLIESKQNQSNLGELSSYVKLNAIKRKKRQEGNKLTMESRQSDSEKMEKNEKIRNSHIKMENLKKTEKDEKNEDFQSKCEQIRKRLRTIHQRQEQVIRGNSP